MAQTSLRRPRRSVIAVVPKIFAYTHRRPFGTRQSRAILFEQLLLGEARQRKGRRMSRARVVPQLHAVNLLRIEPQFGLAQPGPLLHAADHEADLAARVRRHRGHRIAGGGKLRPTMVERLAHMLHVRPECAALRAHDAARPQSALHQRKVRLLEQRRGRADRIAAVRDDDVELAAVLLHVLEAIADGQTHLGRLEATGHERQILARQGDDTIVDLHLVHLLDQRMFGHFACDAAIAAADDQDALGARVGAERYEGDQFLVAELIAFGALDDAVKDERLAEGLAVANMVLLFSIWFECEL